MCFHRCDEAYTGSAGLAPARLGSRAARSAWLVAAGHAELRESLDTARERRWMPQEFRDRGLTLFWWRATLAGLIFR